MGLSEETAALAEALWRDARAGYGPLGAEIDRRLDGLAGDMRALMALAYATLPLGDAAGAGFDTLASFARHGLFLREHSPFCREAEEALFLHFVWYPRVNDESLAGCRELFWQALADRVAGLDATAAALEVNRWCAEHMTYQLTDGRTMSPLTAYRTGTGRCGEESVFCVTALRSVGIPARQVYVPWWAHCDDNHAWVEFWDGGRWRFMGACEPEPAADMGWFQAAAARAPLVRYRTFFDYGADRPAGRMGPARLHAVTERYAPTRPVTVRVTDGAGYPAAGARVELSVVNMGAFRPVLWGQTDESGVLRTALGGCTLHAEAWLDGRVAAGDIPAGDGPAALTLTWGDVTGTDERGFFPGPPRMPDRPVLTAVQRRERARTKERCAALRQARAAAWARPEYERAGEPWARFFRLAGGNAPEIYRLYAACSGRERALAAGMLEAMGEKDLRDASFETLLAHLRGALPHAREEHFIREVLCPRIGLEPPEDWRGAVERALSPAARAAIAEAPERAMAWVRRTVAPAGERAYPPAEAGPAATLAAGLGDGRAMASLAVALLRTCGVPARLDPADGTPEFWRDGAYHPLAGPARTGRICLEPEGPGPWVYGRDWTLSRREEDGWRVLALEDIHGPAEIPAAPGLWRLTAARRLVSGAQYVRTETFVLKPGQTRRVELRAPAAEEEPVCIPLAPFELTGPEGEAVPAKTLLPAGGLLIWVRPGEEPTEHVLGELAQAARQGGALPPLALALALPGPDGGEGLGALLEAYPGQVVYDRDGAGEDLARVVYLEPGELPLTVALDRNFRARYAAAGYRADGTALAIRAWRESR